MTDLQEAQLDESAEATSLSATLRVTVGTLLHVRHHRQREHDDIIVGRRLPVFPKHRRDKLVKDGWIAEDEARDPDALVNALEKMADGGVGQALRQPDSKPQTGE